MTPRTAGVPAPMEAKLVAALPTGDIWQFEPKWDGFRALLLRDGDDVQIISKSGKPLARYFPEIVDLLAHIGEAHFLLDGELILPIGDRLSFSALQQRLHPAASRIARLSAETPAQLMLFDCLRLGDEDFAQAPLTARRAALEAFHRKEGNASLLLSPASRSAPEAEAWLAGSGGALDGVIAKRLDEPYRSGERAMLKVKQRRSADCVVGGFRWTRDKAGVASLLLGLYRDDGKLDHVGHCASFDEEEKIALAAKLQPLIGPPGFTGTAPDAPSRWSHGEDRAWQPLKPQLVVEVGYDQVTGARFRHATRFLRWRPDKSPAQCRMDQLAPELRPSEVEALIGIPRIKVPR